MLRAILVVLACGLVGAQNPLLREIGVPLGSINQLGNWIQQVQRSEYLDCPTNENRFGLSCDVAATSRDDLDNYFCGSSPNDFGWCGAYWELVGDVTWPDGVNRKRGVSNGALALASADEFEIYNTYLQMFGRVCACHCGCSEGCSDGTALSMGNTLFCGGELCPNCGAGAPDFDTAITVPNSFALLVLNFGEFSYSTNGHIDTHPLPCVTGPSHLVVTYLRATGTPPLTVFNPVLDYDIDPCFIDEFEATEVAIADTTGLNWHMLTGTVDGSLNPVYDWCNCGPLLQGDWNALNFPVTAIPGPINFWFDTCAGVRSDAPAFSCNVEDDHYCTCSQAFIDSLEITDEVLVSQIESAFASIIQQTPMCHE